MTSAGVVLIVWYLLSICNQFSLFSSWFGRVVPLSILLPNWRFFAPEPGETDVRIVYRQSKAGSWSTWVELNPVERSVTRFMWNPSKFDSKALTDVVCSLLESAESVVGKRLMMSWSYVLLLHRVSMKCSDETEKVQFAVVETDGFIPNRNITLRFVSYEHRFELK